MSWDSEFFTHRKDVSWNQNEPGRESAKAKNQLKHCSGCNQPIGAVSTALYEIDEKHYCPECYHRTIVKQAVERNHYDLRLEKET